MGTVIGAFVGGLLAIGAAVLIYRSLSGRKDAETVPETPAGPPPDPAPDTADPNHGLAVLMTALVKLNIRLRTAYGLSTDVIDPVENAIDLLKDTVPQMIERHPSETLTYELKRIAAEHLPQIVKEFTDLSAESRERQHTAFLESVGDILDQVRRANEIVAHNEVAEFKVMASFLKTKYSS